MIMADAPQQAPPGRVADLTGFVCPMTFVRFKLEIEKIAPGEAIEIVLKDGEQMRNVPRSIKAEGHRIEGIRQDAGKYRLLVRKKQ